MWRKGLTLISSKKVRSDNLSSWNLHFFLFPPIEGLYDPTVDDVNVSWILNFILPHVCHFDGTGVLHLKYKMLWCALYGIIHLICVFPAYRTSVPMTSADF